MKLVCIILKLIVCCTNVIVLHNKCIISLGVLCRIREILLKKCYPHSNNNSFLYLMFLVLFMVSGHVFTILLIILIGCGAAVEVFLYIFIVIILHSNTPPSIIYSEFLLHLWVVNIFLQTQIYERGLNFFCAVNI